MKIKKENYSHNPEHYYELIEKCRRRNAFSIKRMSQPDFISTQSLKESIARRVKNTAGESVSWRQIQWMRFLKNEPYKMFYKLSLDDSKFHVLHLSPKRGRPKIYENIKLLQLYITIRPSEEKRKDIMSLLPYLLDIMSLLPYIPAVFQEHFKNLKYSK